MYKCSSCGYESNKWFGKCPNCGSWDVVQERTVKSTKKGLVLSESVGLKTLKDVRAPRAGRGAPFPLTEVSHVLGTAVPGGIYLIGGEPGVGKSTLLLQILLEWAKAGKKAIYVSSEESEYQISIRAKRLLGKKAVPNTLRILSYNELDAVLSTVAEEDVDFLVFDSIQGFYSKANDGVMGGVSQLKEATFKIVNFAKSKGVTSFIVGQVTKEGVVSGPKLLEHIVDAVAYLEQGGVSSLRTLRSTKNRFYEVGNLGFLEMNADGFKDARDLYLSWLAEKASPPYGTAYGVALYGTRPLVVQVQALLVDTKYPNPKRTAEGITRNRLELLLAVAQEHVPRMDLSYKDVYVKILGGLDLKDPGMDLAVLASVVSAYFKKSFSNTAFIGEVGLLGSISQAIAESLRVKEAKQLGFKNIIKSTNAKHVKSLKNLLLK